MRKVRVALLAVLGVAALAAWLYFHPPRHSNTPPPEAPCKWDPMTDGSVDCVKKCGASYTGVTAVQSTDKNGKTWYYCCHKGYTLRG
jgi:hypothetical protein